MEQLPERRDLRAHAGHVPDPAGLLLGRSGRSLARRLRHDCVRMVGTAVPVPPEVEQQAKALSAALQTTSSSGKYQEDLAGRPPPQPRAQPKRTVPSQALSL